MHFIISDNIPRFVSQAQNINYPLFQLQPVPWDDYGKKTLFSVFFWPNDKNKLSIGKVKIISSDPKNYNGNGQIVMPPYFKSLNDSYVSLGQNIEYYKQLHNITVFNSEEYLKGINDLPLNYHLIEEFENLNEFKSSLIRYVEAEKALKLGLRAINGKTISSNLKFTYHCRVSKHAGEHVVSFDFSKKNDLSTRTYCIIGENGTGKTQFLSRLALSISGEDSLDDAFFDDSKRPLFSKVIVVSYSAFDDFKIPKKGEKYSYVYCGLKDNGSFISQSRMLLKIKTAIDKIITKERGDILYNIFHKLFSHDDVNMIYTEIVGQDSYQSINSLSSGQKILFFVFCEILSNIRNESIIIFDEPELHLHPTAISRVYPTLNYILECFDSYAIIATHSPLIIQDIPSSHVYLFERYGNTPHVTHLGIESFGENVSKISRYIFNTRDTPPFYQEKLRDLSKLHSQNDIESMFELDLSLNAKLFLTSCYQNEKAKSSE